MKICKICGAQCEDDQTACINCGAGLSEKLTGSSEKQCASDADNTEGSIISEWPADAAEVQKASAEEDAEACTITEKTAADKPEGQHESQPVVIYQPVDARRSTAPVVLGIVSIFIQILFIFARDILNDVFLLCCVLASVCLSTIGLVLAKRDIKDKIKWSGRSSLILNGIALLLVFIFIMIVPAI